MSEQLLEPASPEPDPVIGNANIFTYDEMNRLQTDVTRYDYDDAGLPRMPLIHATTKKP